MSGEVLYHREYENGHVTVYPDVLVVEYTNEEGEVELMIFRYNWFMKDASGFTADGPEDTLYIYTDEKRIKYTERENHDFC